MLRGAVYKTAPAAIIILVQIQRSLAFATNPEEQASNAGFKDIS